MLVVRHNHSPLTNAKCPRLSRLSKSSRSDEQLTEWIVSEKRTDERDNWCPGSRRICESDSKERSSSILTVKPCLRGNETESGCGVGVECLPHASKANPFLCLEAPDCGQHLKLNNSNCCVISRAWRRKQPATNDADSLASVLPNVQRQRYRSQRCNLHQWLPPHNSVLCLKC